MRRLAHVESEHLVMTASATVSGTSLTVKGSGDFDNASHRGVVHATFGASGISGDIDEVMDGTTMYLHSPLFSSTLPAGKTWLELDLQSFSKTHGVDFSALLGQSPTQALAQLPLPHGHHALGERPCRDDCDDRRPLQVR